MKYKKQRKRDKQLNILKKSINKTNKERDKELTRRKEDDTGI
ncbi:MAG: hypothetical protein V8Q71_00115 [Bacilli bacterium]